MGYKIYCDMCEKELFGNLRDFNSEYQSTGKIVCAECKDKSTKLLAALYFTKGDVKESVAKLDADIKIEESKPVKEPTEETLEK